MAIRFAAAALFASLAIAGSAAIASANSVTTITVTGSNAGQPIDGTAVFTITSTGHLTIDLTNNVANPTSASSLLGGIIFTLQPTATFSGVAPTNFSVSGNLIDVNTSTGTYATATSSQISALGANVNWSQSKGDPFTLSVSSGNDPLIIGNPNGSNLYSNANPSLGASHQPFFQNTAEFNMDIAGLTTAATVSAVSFEWGTGYTHFAATGTSTVTTPSVVLPSAVPLPTAACSGLSLLALLGIAARLRKKLAY